jgi:hypothetical protein
MVLPGTGLFGSYHRELLNESQPTQRIRFCHDWQPRKTNFGSGVSPAQLRPWQGEHIRSQPGVSEIHQTCLLAAAITACQGRTRPVAPSAVRYGLLAGCWQCPKARVRFTSRNGHAWATSESPKSANRQHPGLGLIWLVYRNETFEECKKPLQWRLRPVLGRGGFMSAQEFCCAKCKSSGALHATPPAACGGGVQGRPPACRAVLPA